VVQRMSSFTLEDLSRCNNSTRGYTNDVAAVPVIQCRINYGRFVKSNEIGIVHNVTRLHVIRQTL